MNTFELLIKIKTSKNNLSLKAVYVNNWNWEYCVYYYDEAKHTFYINGTDKNRALKDIEQIINATYKKELHSSIDIFRRIYMNKKPKVFYFLKWKDDNFISILKIKLKIIRISPMEIKEFKIID